MWMFFMDLWRACLPYTYVAKDWNDLLLLLRALECTSVQVQPVMTGFFGRSFYLEYHSIAPSGREIYWREDVYGTGSGSFTVADVCEAAKQMELCRESGLLDFRKHLPGVTINWRSSSAADLATI